LDEKQTAVICPPAPLFHDAWLDRLILFSISGKWRQGVFHVFFRKWKYYCGWTAINVAQGISQAIEKNPHMGYMMGKKCPDQTAKQNW